jgi:hypothetical protein
LTNRKPFFLSDFPTIVWWLLKRVRIIGYTLTMGNWKRIEAFPVSWVTLPNSGESQPYGVFLKISRYVQRSKKEYHDENRSHWVMVQGKILIKRHHKVEVGKCCFSASPTVSEWTRHLKLMKRKVSWKNGNESCIFWVRDKTTSYTIPERSIVEINSG